MLKFFADADHGIEWCENEIIAANLAELHIEKDIDEQLKAILIGDNVEKLIPYLQRREYRAGEYLIREGDAADFIYFIHSGQVTAQLESEGKNPVRLETIHSGRTVGEIAFFSAHVVQPVLWQIKTLSFTHFQRKTLGRWKQRILKPRISSIA